MENNRNSFNDKMKSLSVAERMQILPLYFFEILKICFPIIVVSCSLTFILVLLNVGFGYQFPVMPIINLIALISVVAVIYLIFRKFPTSKLINKINDLKKT